MKPSKWPFLAIMVVLLALISAACGTELKGGVSVNTIDSNSMVAGVTSSGSGGPVSVAYMQGGNELSKDVQVNQARLQSIINIMGGKIQNAVNTANDGDTIKVWPGKYYENIFVDKSLAIKGSGASSTIVDGGGNARVFNIGRDTSGTLYPDVVVSLSGLTIQNGKAEDNPIPILDPSSRFGGGIFNAGTLTLDSCLVTNNIADGTRGLEAGGAGIANYGSQLTLKSSVVSNNKAIGFMTEGAGIFNWHDWGQELPVLNVVSSRITNNVAGGTDLSIGGGIWNWGMSTVTKSEISGNQAIDGAGINNYYGSTLNVIGSELYNNVATQTGGGISDYGIATIKSSIIYNNKAKNGGGIYWQGSDPTITNSIILRNDPNNIAHP